MKIDNQPTEQQLKSIFIHAPLAICIFRGPELIVESANKKMLHLWGKQAVQVINKPIFEGLPHLKNQVFEEQLNIVYKTGKRFVESESTIHVLRKGIVEKVFVEFVYEALFEEDGTISGVMALAYEITEQVVARQKVEESEVRFRTLTETLPQLVWVTDEKGDAEFASGRWKEYTGIEPTDQESLKTIVHPDDLESINKVFKHSLSTGVNYKFEARLRSKAGEYRWYSGNGEPVFNNENKIIKWVGSFSDIHIQKSFVQELEKQVESRTRELLTKNMELRNMNKELEALAYVSSHDLQEPLRKIQTFADRITENESHNFTNKSKDYLQRMQDAAKRMRQLIADLLIFIRLNTANRKFEKTDLGAIVEEVKGKLKKTIEEKHAIIEAIELCEINIIPMQFRQVIYNLLGNSLKFSKPGKAPHIIIRSVMIKGNESRTENPELPVGGLLPEKNYWHISVADNGIGFDPQYKAQVFVVFQRLHGKEKYSGTGIGLSMVKKIVENHKGIITVSSEVDKGTTFHIYIPAS